MSIVSLVMPLIGIITGIIFIADPNPSKKAAGKIWLIAAVVSMVMWFMFGLGVGAAHGG